MTEQELQQKTLEEVRREAQKLQMQGKNAQHDDLSRRRKKTQITSAQLAKQSSNLLLHKDVEAAADSTPDVVELAEPAAPPSPTKSVDATTADDASAADVATYATRIKSIIHEYLSIVDLDEAAACVRELPPGACHVEFAEQTINLSLDGKTSEREHAVNLLVGLYERGALTAVVIQAALMAVAEFLEDLRIDIPLVHQYSALLLGHLISAGCFGLSWMIAHPLAHLVECRLASQVFVEVLTVLEVDSDVRSVKRMLVDEEIAVASVLPAAMRGSNDAPHVRAFLLEHGIEDFFNDDDDDSHSVLDDDDERNELDPDVANSMRATLDEYLVVKDVDELVTCINELDVPHRWTHFVQLAVEHSIDSKKTVRDDVAALVALLATQDHVTTDDVEVAFEAVLAQYEDLRVDIPRLSANLSDLYALLFHANVLSLQWLRDATHDLVARGYAAEILSALLSDLDARIGHSELCEWWRKQPERDGLWRDLVDRSDASTACDDLVKWKQVLE